MANTKSAAKRARQTKLRALRNRSVLTRLRKMQRHLASPETQSRTGDLQSMISAIDKAAKRGIIHRNAANRRKGRLNKSFAAPSVQPGIVEQQN